MIHVCFYVIYFSFLSMNRRSTRSLLSSPSLPMGVNFRRLEGMLLLIKKCLTSNARASDILISLSFPSVGVA